MILHVTILSLALIHQVSPTMDASTQEEALDLARRVDLPALEKADKVLIKAGDRQAVVTKTDLLEALRRELKPRTVEPGSSETSYELTFFRGKDKVREVWVHASGEWGFERPKGPSWTIGHEPALVREIKRHLPKP